MKRGTISHPKLEDLAFRLGVKLVEAVGHVEALIHFVAEYAPQGDIAKWSTAAVARRCLWDGNPDAFIDGLVSAGWLDRIGEGLIVHDWTEHADDVVHSNLARKRLYFWDGSSPKLGKLNERERAVIAKFYRENPQQIQGSPTVGRQADDSTPPGVRVQTGSSQFRPINPPYPPCDQSPTAEPPPVASDRPAGAGRDSLDSPETDHAGYVTPPLVFTHGKARDPSADAAWAERIESTWRQRKGGRLRRDQVIGLLADHVDQLGADEVVDRLNRYCARVSGQFATIRNFANCIADWSAAPPAPASEPIRGGTHPSLLAARAEDKARIDRDLARMTPEDREAFLSGDPDRIQDLVNRALAGKLELAAP